MKKKERISTKHFPTLHKTWNSSYAMLRAVISSSVSWYALWQYEKTWNRAQLNSTNEKNKNVFKCEDDLEEKIIKRLNYT